MCFQGITIHFKIACLYRAGKVRNLLKIRIDTALSRFMGNDRYVNTQLFVFIPVGRWSSFINSHVTFGSLVSDIELVGLDTGTGRRTAVQSAAVSGTSIMSKFFDKIKITGNLITIAIENKGRMIAILFQNGFLLATEEIITGFVRFSIFSPHRHFHFKIYSQFISHPKCSRRRTPRMKTHVIHSIVFQDSQHTFPRRIIHRRIACFREDSVLYCST